MQLLIIAVRSHLYTQMAISFSQIILSASLLATAHAELFLHDAAILTKNTSLSPKCVKAMSSSIDCDPALLSFASVGYVEFINPSVLSSTLCHSSCVSSVTAYRQRVLLGCSTVDAWPGLPASYNGDFVQAYQNQTCLKDTSGGWCNSKLFCSKSSNQVTDQIFPRHPRQHHTTEKRRKIGGSPKSRALFSLHDCHLEAQPVFELLRL
jgi:hypothetical protein